MLRKLQFDFLQIVTEPETTSQKQLARRNFMDTAAASSSVNQDSASVPQGLDEATILSYPKLLYSQAKNHEGACTTSGCSICLQDYKDTDMLRLLPECGHLFHLSCVDPWLKLHSTCPICRNSPMPSPLQPPLAVEITVPQIGRAHV